MMRMREGMPLRSKEMMRFENAVTTVTEVPITKAGFSLAVTAKQEQMPSTNIVTGLVLRRGSMRRFLAFIADDNRWIVNIALTSCQSFL